MSTTNLAFASAGTLAAKIRTREIGCLELLDFYIARVNQFDGALNAVVVRDFDRARERARALDDGEPTGPLHGVPMTVKESYNVAGLPTTWGVPELRGNIAATTAVAATRLENAGAVIFGKTNVPKMLADWQSYNDVYGRTNNPWNLARTPGGSSGGAAAALAAGLTALEAGSDIGGSIRQPAHACGLFGHKPTFGLVPQYGHALVENPALTDISVLGPLARSAGDLRLALQVMVGPEETETALELSLPPPRQFGLQGLRIAVWAEEPGQGHRPGDHDRPAGACRRARAVRRRGGPHRSPGLRRGPCLRHLPEDDGRRPQRTLHRGEPRRDPRPGRQARGGQSLRRRRDRPLRGHDARHLARPEPGAAPSAPGLGRVLPGLGRAAMPGHRRAGLAARHRHSAVGAHADDRRRGRPLQQHAVLERHRRGLSPAGQRRAAGGDGGGPALRCADRRAALWRPHDDGSGLAAGTRLARVHATAGLHVADTAEAPRGLRAPGGCCLPHRHGRT
ncbi:MAG: amidase family protein [Acetobacteraceae bacterium]